MNTWIEALKTGREIEFEYNNRVYFIGNYDEGRCICNDENEEITKYYTDIDLFLSEATINEYSLSQLIKSGNIKIVTIF
jgi:hypothetical protein